MLFQRLALGMMLAIAATISIQPSAFSQTNASNPTHTRLSEVGTSSTSSLHPPTHSQFKNSTQPRLSEIGTPTMMPAEMSESQMPESQMSESRMAPVQFNGGQAFFSHPPRLMRAYTSQSQAYVPSTYEFTLVVPSDAGQALKAVRIAQERNLDTVKFDVGRSKAFAGARYASGAEIPLANVGGESVPGEATIVFDQPVQPGSTITIALEAKANPASGGIYEFGVTAFPVGEHSMSQFLGFGRLGFYSGGAQ